MTIKFHEERIARCYFPKDGEGQSQGFLRPLRSRWLPQATGMFVRAWGTAPDSSPTDQAFEVSVLGMSAFEGSESGNGLAEVDGNEDIGVTLDCVGVSAGGVIGSTPVSVWAPANIGGSGGVFTYSASTFYSFENLGASYANLALKFYPHSFEDTGVEPPVTYLGNPTWAAARILYQVED